MLAITSPFAQFFDTNGSPLNNGRIYFGVVGTNPLIPSNQIPIYWDSEKTQPAAQPVQVLNGLIHRSGTPAQIFTDVGYSISIYDNRNRLVAYSPYGQKGSILDFSIDLSGPQGSSLIGFKQSGLGAVNQVLQKKVGESISPTDFGAVGDGLTNDSANFAFLESEFSGKTVNLLGKTYFVDVVPFGNKYVNGFFKTSSGTFQANYQPPMNGRNRYVMGDNALASLPEDYVVGDSGSVIAIGVNAMRDTTAVKKSIAIGPGAMRESIINRDNIAIGEDALQRVQSRSADYSQSEQQGTRNIAIGANSGNFIYEGYRNVLVGRNTGQTIVNGIDNTAIGMNAMSGEVMFGLSGQIENNSPYNGNGATAVGNFALAQYIGNGPMVAIGQNASYSARLGTHGVSVGYNAARGADSNIDGFGNTVLWEGSETGTYSHSGNTLTLTVPDSHGAAVGCRIRFRLLDGGSQTPLTDSATAIVTSVSGGVITVNHPVSRTASGSALLQRVSSQTPATSNARDYVVIGSNACSNSQDLRDSVVIGMVAGSNTNSVFRSTIAGSNAARFVTTVNQSVVIGRNAAAGSSANPPTLLENSVILGEGACVTLQNGSPFTTLQNVVCLGNGSLVSGNNQVQLGKSSATTYAYGAVQDRSDARDKAEIRNTVLGLDFIKDLRAVDYKLDMREDYFETVSRVVEREVVEEIEVPTVLFHANGRPIFRTERVSRVVQDTVEEIVQLPKDGSKIRKRFHHGLIAQELRDVMKKHGVDFGGFQDHSINGGCDVLSIGYTELIGPMIKAIQQLSERLEKSELLIEKLNGG